jgi:hypothetical protein|tara:strand:+ start:2873 stop:3076 length:204 start_codon:yes stop_codon:yes gene_type:complete
VRPALFLSRRELLAQKRGFADNFLLAFAAQMSRIPALTHSSFYAYKKFIPALFLSRRELLAQERTHD